MEVVKIGRKLIFTNANGDTITFGDNVFSIKQLDGLEKPEGIKITNKAVNQRGSTLFYVGRGEREISVTGFVNVSGTSQIYQKRKEMQYVLNDEIGLGTLTVNIDDEIVLTSQCVPDFTLKNPIGIQEFLVVFTCPDPYLYGESETINMPYATGGISFPLVIPEEGISFGEVAFRQTVINDGQAETPITIYAYGAFTGLRINNLTTSKYMAISQTVLDGEYVEITTEDNNMFAYLYKADGTNVDIMDKWDFNGDFWHLQSGENVIEWSITTRNPSMRVEVNYAERYLGV